MVTMVANDYETLMVILKDEDSDHDPMIFADVTDDL